MLRIPTRRLLAATAATAITTVATIVAGAAPAHAAASGQLLVKGTGSVYTDNNGVNLGIIPGTGTKSFFFKVVNTGSENQQYTVDIEVFSSDMTASLFSGYKAVASPFTTAVIRPGGSAVLTLKIAVDAGAAQDEYIAAVDLLDPLTNDVLDSSFADANATYQTGTTQHDLFLKTGSQPFVGGSVAQFLTASTLKVGQTATFTIRLKNNGATPATWLSRAIEFPMPGDLPGHRQAGVHQRHRRVEAGSYSTGSLNPGAKKELKVTDQAVAGPGLLQCGLLLLRGDGPGRRHRLGRSRRQRRLTQPLGSVDRPGISPVGR